MRKQWWNVSWSWWYISRNKLHTHTYTPAGSVMTWACSGARFDCVSLLTLAVVWAVCVLTETRLTELRVQTTLIDVYSIQQHAHVTWHASKQHLVGTSLSVPSTVLHCTTLCSVECCCHCSDETVHYKSDETVNFCSFICATTSPITVFINFVFLHLYCIYMQVVGHCNHQSSDWAKSEVSFSSAKLNL